ncbi:type II toxin-antitoxin system RelB/DinJ family antitoxin [Lacticaseibacillus zeae]|uniref:Type II toxin-antitoxin system RelB/DinJ family antitoxin n=2 Tax=Lacticaseibacillus zeae TaxID=57037 RepID=A0A5R8LQR1_LACZE|nr:type II toxin-antitoxin system RelB/DinJ family antitoxin [Lacticaseibacillus zeae]
MVTYTASWIQFRIKYLNSCIEVNFMATARQTTMTIRLDATTRDAAEQVFEALGMDLNTGINILLKQVVHDQALPFTPTMEDSLDRATEQSIQDLKFGRYQEFDNLGDLFEDLHNEN